MAMSAFGVEDNRLSKAYHRGGAVGMVTNRASRGATAVRGAGESAANGVWRGAAAAERGVGRAKVAGRAGAANVAGRADAARQLAGARAGRAASAVRAAPGRAGEATANGVWRGAAATGRAGSRVADASRAARTVVRLNPIKSGVAGAGLAAAGVGAEALRRRHER